VLRSFIDFDDTGAFSSTEAAALWILFRKQMNFYDDLVLLSIVYTPRIFLAQINVYELCRFLKLGL